MESVLENHTIAIYSVGKKKQFGRLTIASQGMKDVFANSICMKDYLEANEAVEAGNVWVNREFLEGYPMCMKGIQKTESS